MLYNNNNNSNNVLPLTKGPDFSGNSYISRENIKFPLCLEKPKAKCLQCLVRVCIGVGWGKLGDNVELLQECRAFSSSQPYRSWP